jgi:hypothetical protein
MAPKKLTASELTESGILFKINHTFLHPLGLALTAEVEDGELMSKLFNGSCRTPADIEDALSVFFKLKGF